LTLFREFWFYGPPWNPRAAEREPWIEPGPEGFIPVLATYHRSMGYLFGAAAPTSLLPADPRTYRSEGGLPGDRDDCTGACASPGPATTTTIRAAPTNQRIDRQNGSSPWGDIRFRSISSPINRYETSGRVKSAEQERRDLCRRWRGHRMRSVPSKLTRLERGKSERPWERVPKDVGVELTKSFWRQFFRARDFFNV
jgi:hypothetical protein